MCFWYDDDQPHGHQVKQEFFVEKLDRQLEIEVNEIRFVDLYVVDGYLLILTWNFNNLFVCNQIQLIEHGIVFSYVFITTLFLFPSEYRTIDWNVEKKKRILSNKSRWGGLRVFVMIGFS